MTASKEADRKQASVQTAEQRAIPDDVLEADINDTLARHPKLLTLIAEFEEKVLSQPPTVRVKAKIRAIRPPSDRRPVIAYESDSTHADNTSARMLAASLARIKEAI